MALTEYEKEELDCNLADIIECTYARSSKGIWSYIEQTPSIKNQKDAFLYILETLLRQGKVKIGREHRLLDMFIEEVIQSFKDNWPSEEEFDEDHFSTVKPYKVKGKKLLHSHYWTPGDLVWINSEYGDQWSTDAEH